LSNKTVVWYKKSVMPAKQPLILRESMGLYGGNI